MEEEERWAEKREIKKEWKDEKMNDNECELKFQKKREMERMKGKDWILFERRKTFWIEREKRWRMKMELKQEAVGMNDDEYAENGERW